MKNNKGWLPRIVLPDFTHGQSVLHYFYATRQYLGKLDVLAVRVAKNQPKNNSTVRGKENEKITFAIL